MSEVQPFRAFGPGDQGDLAKAAEGKKGGAKGPAAAGPGRKELSALALKMGAAMPLGL